MAKYIINKTKYINGDIFEKWIPLADLEKRKKKRNNAKQDTNSESQKMYSRITSTRSRIIKLACSTKMTHFLTFKSDVYAHSPKEFIKAVYDYLKEINSDMKFITVLEVNSDERKGFHIHALTNQAVDMSDWIIENGKEEEQYCDKIRTNTRKCIGYISKKIGLTKFYIAQGERVYKSNDLKQVKPEYITEIVDIDDETITNNCEKNDFENENSTIKNEINSSENEKSVTLGKRLLEKTDLVKKIRKIMKKLILPIQFYNFSWWRSGKKETLSEVFTSKYRT